MSLWVRTLRIMTVCESVAEHTGNMCESAGEHTGNVSEIMSLWVSTLVMCESF